MRLLITGSNGQLGSEIKDLKTNFKKINFVFKDLPEFDICDFGLVNNFIINQNIDTVINCAAYTDVDKSEDNPEIAEKVNSIGVSNLVKALENVNGRLIHISTDYVFDGTQSKPYTELDSVSPIGIYGKTKRFGELAVINSNIDAIIIRTSWLYSSYGNNFLKTMIHLGNQKASINIIFDQIGTPTYAKDLAKTCLDILSNTAKISKKGKIYHYSNEGIASWYDFAFLIMKITQENCKVKPIQTKDYPTLAKRPQYSVLNKSKIKTDFKIDIPHWIDSLNNCINKIKQ